MEVTSMPDDWQPDSVVSALGRINATFALQPFLDAITNGEFDDDLEAILAAAHGRKRAKRGVRNPRGLGRV